MGRPKRSVRLRAALLPESHRGRHPPCRVIGGGKPGARSDRVRMAVSVHALMVGEGTFIVRDSVFTLPSARQAAARRSRVAMACAARGPCSRSRAASVPASSLTAAAGSPAARYAAASSSVTPRVSGWSGPRLPASRRPLQDGHGVGGLACPEQCTAQADACRDDSRMPRREFTALLSEHPLVQLNGLCRGACRQVGASQMTGHYLGIWVPRPGLASHRAASSRQYSTAGPVRPRRQGFGRPAAAADGTRRTTACPQPRGASWPSSPAAFPPSTAAAPRRATFPETRLRPPAPRAPGPAPVPTA